MGRDELLAQIHERLFQNPTASLTPGHIQVMTALGGAGKTTFARHYAEKFWRPYRQIFWIDCRAGLETGFARIHDKLRPAPEFAGLPNEVKAAWARDELRNPRRELTLLIPDNAEDQDSVAPWLPHAGNCHTLITSRFTAWTGGIETCDVEVFTPNAARDLLMRSSGINATSRDTADERTQADATASTLEYLPLALEQAAAYVRKQPPGFGFTGYLRLYGQNERRMLDAGTRGGTDYSASVYLTWKTTVDHLPEGARRILQLHSWLAPTAFPVDLYIQGAAAIVPEASEFDIRDWIGSLLDYSMAVRTEGDAISVHGLVQTVERHWCTEQGIAAQSYEAIRSLFGENAPGPTWEPASRKLWDVLLPHAEALRTHAAIASESTDTRLLWKMGQALRERGDYRGAIPSHQDALTIADRTLGAEHSETLTAANNLALVYDHLGRFSEAEALYRRVLDASERTLGPEHPHTLTTMNNLAAMSYQRKKYPEAEAMYRRALETQERTLGPDHPDTLTSTNNLATLFDNQGRYDEAEPLHRRALEARERILGVEHPHTLMSVATFGGWYFVQGRYDEAESLTRRALEVRERILGSEHPDTLTSLFALGSVYSKQGRYEDAGTLYRRAFEGAARVLGPEHPLTTLIAGNFRQLAAISDLS